MKLFAFFLFIGCSSLGGSNNPVENRNESNVFTYTDSGGEYRVSREFKVKKKQLISRIKMFSLKGSKELESIVSISKIGGARNLGLTLSAAVNQLSSFAHMAVSHLFVAQSCRGAGTLRNLYTSRLV